MDTTRVSLLLRIRDRGDESAWSEFDGLYRPMILRFAAAMGVAREDAEEIAQQCLATIADRIDEFDYDPRRGRFKGWLRTMVKNRVRNYWRDRRDFQAETRMLEGATVEDPSPEEVFDRMWLEEHLWRCIRELRSEVEDRTFRAFQLYVVEQHPIEDVCAALGLTRNNVYTIKWRLTERIAHRMSALIGEVG